MRTAINKLSNSEGEASKAQDIKSWRETNVLLEPLDLKLNKHQFDEYKKYLENNSDINILENPSSFAEWFAKT